MSLVPISHESTLNSSVGTDGHLADAAASLTKIGHGFPPAQLSVIVEWLLSPAGLTQPNLPDWIQAAFDSESEGL